MNGLKTLQPAYGFDDVAIVPGNVTISPDMPDTTARFDGLEMEIPFLAAAMDSVVDVNFAAKMGEYGGLAIMNMDGLHTRYTDTEPIYAEIAAASKDDATELMQKLYSQPINPELIGQRIEEIKSAGGKAAVSFVDRKSVV